jgi:hypothetical protein
MIDIYWNYAYDIGIRVVDFSWKLGRKSVF